MSSGWMAAHLLSERPILILKEEGRKAIEFPGEWGSLSPGREDAARSWGLGLSGEGAAQPGLLGPGQDRTLALILPVTHVLNGHRNDKRPFSASAPHRLPSILIPLQPAVQVHWPGWWLPWLLFH